MSTRTARRPYLDALEGLLGTIDYLTGPDCVTADPTERLARIRDAIDRFDRHHGREVTR